LTAFITADAPFYAQNTHQAQVGKQMMIASVSATQNGVIVGWQKEILGGLI
jgi:hypothetical protein